MLDILVLRHGQSTADIEKRLEGRADFELTELGRQQAERASQWIEKNFKPETIISSPLKRASKTAGIISEKIHVSVIYDDSLMEWDNGLLAGLSISEAHDRYPLPEGGRKPYDTFYGTESLIAFRSRAEAFWCRLLDKYNSTDENRKICIVSHGKMIDMLFRSFLNLPMESDVFIYTGDTGMHLWRVEGDSRNIIFTNKIIEK